MNGVNRGTLFLNREKNVQALLDLEITPGFRKTILKDLEHTDYSQGPIVDKMLEGADLWIFGKDCQEQRSLYKDYNGETKFKCPLHIIPHCRVSYELPIKIKIMKSPITGKEMSLARKKSTLTFRKEEFTLLSHFYVCEDSGEEFSSTEIDELNIRQIHNQYRDKYNLPFAAEIKSIRSKYGLPATRMSEILGFGINSYRNNENGEVPSLSNGKLIQLVNDPRKFRDMVDLCDTLSEKEKSKIIQKVNDIIYEGEKESSSLEIHEYLLGSRMPDAKTGYVKPDFVKLTEMVKFFSERLKPWKTVLNKLLFYSDFLAYRSTCYSMSGVRYRAIQMGPVPNNYDSIYEFMFNSNEIKMDNVLFKDGGFGYKFDNVENSEFNSEIFSEKEIEILESVSAQFKNKSTKEVIEFSHKEKAWLENNQEKKLIDYTYAFDIIQL